MGHGPTPISTTMKNAADTFGIILSGNISTPSKLASSTLEFPT